MIQLCGLFVFIWLFLMLFGVYILDNILMALTGAEWEQPESPISKARRWWDEIQDFDHESD